MKLNERRSRRHAKAQETRVVRGAQLTTLAAALLGLGPTGCSSDDAPAREPASDGGSLYAVMYEVYDDTGSSSYLSLLDSLDRSALDLSRAREYGRGRAFVQAYNGWLFVGEAESPTVTRYSITDGGALVEEDTMSFANFGLQTGQFDAWNVTFVSPEKAYLLDFNDGKTIIWDPSAMSITGEIPAPEPFYREGLSLEGSPGVVRDGRLYRTFNWVNYDDATYSTDFLLAVYDVDRDELSSLTEETRCPVPGNLVHRDEAGALYFSNWIWPVAGTVLRGAPESCVLRINPGEDGFDPEWTLRYPDVTGGRLGAMFSYLGDDHALVSVFYDERIRFDRTTDPWSYAGSSNWRIWSVSLEDHGGAPLEGLDFNGGAFTPLQFDGRLFLMVPGGAEEDYATKLYEVEGGRAEPLFELPGWSYQLVKVR